MKAAIGKTNNTRAERRMVETGRGVHHLKLMGPSLTETIMAVKLPA